MSLLLNKKKFQSFHFAGILGSGMSALAQYLRWSGCSVGGSDRLLSSSDVVDVKNGLLKAGCRLYPQDGSGINTDTQALVVSTAIEEDNPEIIAARARALPIVHRSDVLAAIIATKKTIAIAGTSGKSTVSAMIFEFLRACGTAPSLITGANLIQLQQEGFVGNACAGTSDILVVEADESDGTLVKYHPSISVILNVSKDHKAVPETLAMFKALAAQSKDVIVNRDDAGLATIPAHTVFSINQAKPITSPQKNMTRFVWNKTAFTLLLPGAHNLSNAVAALCVCKQLGCSVEKLVTAVAGYKGVYRRFFIMNARRDIMVVDDYAHNPEKIKAALSTAQALAPRVIAIFQPHGYGPLRFFKDELIQVFIRILRPEDLLFMLPVYFAGGTAQKDISSEDVSGEVERAGKNAWTIATREKLLAIVTQQAQNGDCILLMGARDPSLGLFAREIVKKMDAR